jgi:hypothetical protein
VTDLDDSGVSVFPAACNEVSAGARCQVDDRDRLSGGNIASDLRAGCRERGEQERGKKE